MATEISAERRAALIALTDRLRARQSLPLGILAGFAAALAGAAAWAAVSFFTGFQIGYLAVGIGFVVGYAIRTVGGGFTRPFGIAGAVLSLLGCVLGNLAVVVAEVAKQSGIPFATVAARLGPGDAVELMRESFQAMDLLFYGIAVYFGYKYSLRRITKEEAAALPD
jgi:hypothetical protein